jgi:glycosyltransferase involved in cell wall biosynthesis
VIKKATHEKMKKRDGKKQNRRVCIIKFSYYPQHTHVFKDARTLTEEGYEVDVICVRTDDQISHEIIDGVEVHRMPMGKRRGGMMRYVFEYGRFFLFTFWKLTCLSLKKRFKVIEVDNLPDFLVFAALVPKLMGAKVVLYFFELMPEVFTDQFEFSSNHPLVRGLLLVERLCSHFSDHTIAANGICQQEILEARNKSAKKMSVVLNVPFTEKFTKDNITISDDGKFRLITHGSLLERYGVQTLIKAVPLLKEDIPNLDVKILGAGEYRSQLEELSQSLGITDCVHFAGFVSVEEMTSSIVNAHIGIVTLIPQRQPQMPNKLFDYLALGKPIVTTAMPAIMPYFDDNSVMYYEPDNEHDLARCILELYKKPEKREALVAAGTVVYHKYQWENMRYEYLKVYDRLAMGRTDSKEKSG